MGAIIITGFLVLSALWLLGVFFAWQAFKSSQQAKPADPSFQLLQQQLDALRAQMTEGAALQTQNMNQQIGQLTGQVSQQLSSMTAQLSQTQSSVGERLDHASRMVGDVQRSLGTLNEASRQIFEIGKNISSLQDILKPPKLRGGFGELLLANLLEQVLQRKHFELQYKFKTGDQVDAVLKIGPKWLSVDSKFPLENFKRQSEAVSDEDRSRFRKLFLSDVKKHVEAIASKYILPDEGTYDFALMYIPAENVYYETIIKDEALGEEGKSLLSYMMTKKVIPVSPNSFYAYLEAILRGLKGLEIEEYAKVILENLARLSGDFERFKKDFDVLGKHVAEAKGKYDETARRLERFGEKLSQSGHFDKTGASVIGPVDSGSPDLIVHS